MRAVFGEILLGLLRRNLLGFFDFLNRLFEQVVPIFHTFFFENFSARCEIIVLREFNSRFVIVNAAVHFYSAVGDFFNGIWFQSRHRNEQGILNFFLICHLFE